MNSERAVLLIPVFNDWAAAALLLDDLDSVFATTGLRTEVLLVDDGSSESCPAGFGHRDFRSIEAIDVLRLRRNVGHQRAIAIGLVHIQQNVPCRCVVVMDGDGEDRAADVPRLIQEFSEQGEQYVIFAARAKRLERPAFRVLYHVYRGIHRVVTGAPVRVGNFSVIPFAVLARLAVTPEIWNHYAAAVIRSGVAWKSIPIARGRRSAGESKMNFIGLLLHGLSAFFVYGDIVGARLLVGIALLSGFAVLLAAAALAAGMTAGIHFSEALALGAALAGIVLALAVPIALILIFVVIGSRVNIGFLPIRDCPYFIHGVERIFPTGR